MYIKEIEYVFRNTLWSKSDVFYIMGQFRLIIEDNNLQEKYNYLNLYCNWTLHTEISGSATAYGILKEISDELNNQAINPENSKWLNDAVIEGLSLHKLLKDIINIGKEYNIRGIDKFNKIQVWKLFAKKLINILSQKPLKFPDSLKSKLISKSIILCVEKNKTKEQKAENIIVQINDKIINSEIKYGYCIFSIQLICDENTYSYQMECIGLTENSKSFMVEGELAFITQEMIDEHYGK